MQITVISPFKYNIKIAQPLAVQPGSAIG